MPRILILYASVGTGHKSAAGAIAEVLALEPNNEVFVEDTLEYASAAFRAVYRRSYLAVTENAPQLWKLFYDRLDTSSPRESAAATRMRGAVERLGVTRLDAMVQQLDPAAIICTHPLPAELLLRLRESQGLRAPIYLVVTDHVAHDVWICPGVDGYFVASELPREMMIARGVPAAIVHTTGIPVGLESSRPKDRAEMRARYELPPEAPVIVLFGGGIDPQRVRRLVEGLLAIEHEALLVVVAGRNEELIAALEGLVDGPQLRLRVYGFIEFVDDLLAACDLVISKAGGLTTSEVLARGTPLLVIDPIPGHEEWNADYVVSVGAGMQLRMPEAVPRAVGLLLDDAPRLAKLAERARSAGRPHAAHEIALAIKDAVHPGGQGWLG